jgi:hypothetical protein
MKCKDTCPVCNKICTYTEYEHKNEDGSVNVHKCGRHWWYNYRIGTKTQFICGLTDFSAESKRQMALFRAQHRKPM